MKKTLVVILFLTAAIFIIIFVSGIKFTVEGRNGNDFEYAYMDFAFKLEDPAICSKISPRAYHSGAWGGEGKKISFLKSDCLYNLALKTQNSYYCNEIETVSTIFLDGSKISKENCLISINNNSHPGSGTSFDHQLVLKSMGYTEESFPQNYSNEENMWGAFYTYTIYTDNLDLLNDFKNRIDKLTNYNE